jgi:hypothetical protein
LVTIHDLKNKGIRTHLGALLATKGNSINKGGNGKAVRATMQLPSADLLGLREFLKNSFSTNFTIEK